MTITSDQLERILEAILLASAQPLSLEKLQSLFEEEERPEVAELQDALLALEQDCKNRGFELLQVASGYRYQVKAEYANWVSRLWEEKPQRYTRAMLETLALIAYRQPITRGEIEAIRGVAVSTSIIKTLQDHEWIRVIGHKDLPGRPALYATSRHFLDHFNLKSLDELPTLSQLRDLDTIEAELGMAQNSIQITSSPIADEATDQPTVNDEELSSQEEVLLGENEILPEDIEV